MEAKIVQLEPLVLAGQPYYGNPQGGAFGKAWDRFNLQFNSIPGRINPKIAYGLEVYGPEFRTERNWTYMPCAEVKEVSVLPEPLFFKLLPACTYVVFTADHGLVSIPEAFMYGYEQWIPASGYEVAYPFDFELYDMDRFQGDGPHAEIDVYIPIRRKAA